LARSEITAHRAVRIRLAMEEWAEMKWGKVKISVKTVLAFNVREKPCCQNLGGVVKFSPNREIIHFTK
jgi:hypothetical protein